ncbi:MAG: hypothetical protein NZ928_03625 [Endomicrobia bacterium]|nr:hypothetical protein [Endomicrobiia bacterium]MDW8056238.1 hypothetical protein [Elusimicrobiota bacterium]
MKEITIKKISYNWIPTTLLLIFVILGAIIGIFTFFIFPTAAAAGLGLGAKFLAWIIFIILYALIMTVGIFVLVWLYNSMNIKPIVLSVETELGD